MTGMRWQAFRLRNSIYLVKSTAGYGDENAHVWRIYLNKTRFAKMNENTHRKHLTHQPYHSIHLIRNVPTDRANVPMYIWHVLCYSAATVWTPKNIQMHKWMLKIDWSCSLPFRSFSSNLFYCNIFSIVSWISISKTFEGMWKSILPRIAYRTSAVNTLFLQCLYIFLFCVYLSSLCLICKRFLLILKWHAMERERGGGEGLRSIHRD